MAIPALAHETSVRSLDHYDLSDVRSDDANGSAGWVLAGRDQIEMALHGCAIIGIKSQRQPSGGKPSFDGAAGHERAR
jgi:hypothetical protein